MLAAGLAALALFGLQAGAHEDPPDNLLAERRVAGAVPPVREPNASAAGGKWLIRRNFLEPAPFLSNEYRGSKHSIGS